MTKYIALLFTLLTATTAADAEVIKCRLATGKIVYQSTPCSSMAVSQKKVEIKQLSPRQLEEARSKLKAWQAQQAATEDAKIKAAKELQQELARQETINALNRNALAQEQQAFAAQRQAEALENRYNTNFYSIPVGPFYYPPQSNGMGHNDRRFDKHHGNHREDSQPPRQDQKRPIGSLIPKSLMD
ncbi:MAG: hypothetical protein HOP23_08780 [Methylococcaceae bacterium]|nr:hypothetical protein [Methylococcaceae bacterium]